MEKRTFETERLILRPWDESDAGELYIYAKDPAVGPICGWQPHANVEQSREVIRTILSEPETYAVVLKETGKPVGSIGLMLGGRSNAKLPENEAEIGFWIGVPWQGRGLIPEAVRRLLRYAFEELKVETVWCGHFDGNEKSRRVQEKCGFTYVRTLENVDWPPLGKTVTEHISKLTREEWEEMQK